MTKIEMTNEEAIQILKQYLDMDSEVNSEYLEAQRMAIKALEQQPCDDCISKAEVIDIINFEDEWLFDANSHNADTKIAFSTIKSKISEMPSVTPKARWIPVSERLPEEDGEYLVCYEEGYRKDYDFDEVGIAPFEVDCEGFGYWQPHYDKSTFGYLDSDWTEISVIAWQPLPEPYKEENNGE